MNRALLCLDHDPAPAAVIIPLAVIEAVMLTEAATDLHLSHHRPPGLHLAAAGPAHILAAIGTLPVVVAATTAGTREDSPVALLLGTTGHTPAPSVVRPLWIAIREDATGHNQDPQNTADTITAEVANINVSFPDRLPDPSEAGQDPGLWNAPLL